MVQQKITKSTSYIKLKKSVIWSRHWPGSGSTGVPAELLLRGCCLYGSPLSRVLYREGLVGPLTPPGSRLASGLLERPVFPPPVAIDTASYKIFVSGKSGVGKTALVAKLAGLEVPVVHHETTGEFLLGGLPWGREKTHPGPHEPEPVTSPTCYSATPESLCTSLSLHERLCPTPWDCSGVSTRVGFPCGSDGKESACNAGDLVRSLGWEDPLEEGMPTHPTILAWRIPWTEELGRLQFVGL